MYSQQQVREIYHLPMMELVERAHEVHKLNFAPDQIQTSRLLSVKTGGCPENCAYCPQSAHYKTGVQKERLMTVEEVEQKAHEAKGEGATRFCMGAAWREVKDGPDFDSVIEMVRAVKSIGLEPCCTLGMVTQDQAERLKEAGLYAYNHNIDTSSNYYKEIISTREFEDRLETIENVRKAGVTVCTGGILGMGESDEDRVAFLHTLARMDPQPESVTVNTLVRIPGTPLEDQPPIHPSHLIRVIASARLLMPHSMIRLSAGRKERTPLEQFFCFYVGANSIFLGDKLLTSPNPEVEDDFRLFEDFNLRPMEAQC